MNVIGGKSDYQYYNTDNFANMLTHISNNYCFSTVHSSLTNGLAAKGVKAQFVYSPIQKKAEINPLVNSHNSVSVSQPRIFNQLLRYFPMTKVLFSFFCFVAVLRKRKVKPTFIIAHNLWSDGMVAWLYHRLTGVQYTVAVRNTDINLFLPKLKHYRWFLKRVVSDSKRLIFINNAYAERLKFDYPSVYQKAKRAQIIYNGINRDWLVWRGDIARVWRKPQAIYVGSFVINKNLRNTMRALNKINSAGLQVTFTAIGGSEEEFLRCTELESKPKWVTVIPKTNDRSLIAKHMQDSRVFVMPSFRETFGLVYIEALSQGCCLVHSKNEGIDGLFDEPFIRSVNPYDTDEIASNIKILVRQYQYGLTKEDTMRLVTDFSWDAIAEKYLEIINEGII